MLSGLDPRFNSFTISMHVLDHFPKFDALCGMLLAYESMLVQQDHLIRRCIRQMLLIFLDMVVVGVNKIVVMSSHNLGEF